MVRLALAFLLLLSLSAFGCFDARQSAQLEAPRALAKLESPALEEFSALLPNLRLPETSLLELKTWAEMTARRETRQIVKTWQEGDYPLARDFLKTADGKAIWFKLKPFSQLSRNERLLLRMEWTANKERDLTCWQSIIARMNIANVQKVRSFDDVKKLWHKRDRAQLAEIFGKARGDTARFKKLLETSWLPRFASPVAGTFFEPWHEKFKPGMGYIVQITDEKELASIRQTLIESMLLRLELRARERAGVSAAPEPEEEKQTPKQKVSPTTARRLDLTADNLLQRCKFFYFRIYGEEENSVIAEGIWQVQNFQLLTEEQRAGF